MTRGIFHGGRRQAKQKWGGFLTANLR